MHYKCVVLVIAHDDPAMKPFKDIWEENWNSHSDILSDYACFYLYNDESLASCKQVGNNLYFPFKETYPAPGLLQKTFGAIDFLNDRGITYDMIYRTNLSSLICWKGFVNHVETHIHDREYYAGNPYGVGFISGSGMFLSNDLVSTLRHNIQSMDFSIADDHSMNLWFHRNKPGLQFQYIESVEDSKGMASALKRGVFHFRFNSLLQNQDAQRTLDHKRMRDMYATMMSPQYGYTVHMIVSCMILLSLILLCIILLS